MYVYSDADYNMENVVVYVVISFVFLLILYVNFVQKSNFRLWNRFSDSWNFVSRPGVLGEIEQMFSRNVAPSRTVVLLIPRPEKNQKIFLKPIDNCF